MLTGKAEGPCKLNKFFRKEDVIDVYPNVEIAMKMTLSTLHQLQTLQSAIIIYTLPKPLKIGCCNSWKNGG